MGVSVDVIAGGREAARESGLARLAEATGGAFVVEDDFGASFAENVAAAARRPAGRRRGRSTLTVRTPPGVRVTRVVGPAEAVAEEEKRAATETAAVAGKATADASVAFALAGDDPSRVSTKGGPGGENAPLRFFFPRRSPAVSVPFTPHFLSSGKNERAAYQLVVRHTNGGRRVKRLRENDPSRALHRKPRGVRPSPRGFMRSATAATAPFLFFFEPRSRLSRTTIEALSNHDPIIADQIFLSASFSLIRASSFSSSTTRTSPAPSRRSSLCCGATNPTPTGPLLDARRGA